MGVVADAPKGNWVDRYAPAWTRPYLRLSRADRPIGTWLLYVPCLWGVALAAMADSFRLWDLWIVLSCGVGAFLMRGAGCTWNDITDRDFDAAVTRTREKHSYKIREAVKVVKLFGSHKCSPAIFQSGCSLFLLSYLR